MVTWTIPLAFLEQSEEQLQAELNASGDIALAASIAKSASSPSLSNWAEERAIKNITSIGFKADILSFPEVGIFLDRNVLVVVGITANAGIVT